MRRAFKKALNDFIGDDDQPGNTGSSQQHFPGGQPPPVPPHPGQQPMSFPPVSRPSSNDVMRYRYHHGANLGSIFVLEKWLHGSMYDGGAKGNSELDAIKASIKAVGLPGTVKKWQEHWAKALTDDDLTFLVEKAHCTNIRLPIGYFTLGPHFSANTPFAGAPGEVYANAWQVVKDMVARCYARGIGVLIDLHGAPGGANDEIHSGTSSGKSELWGNKFNLNLATRCCTFIAQEVVHGGMVGVTGIQLCNESHWDPPGMYEWYDASINAIGQIDPTIPVYVSDGWDLKRALKWVIGKNSVYNPGPRNPVIIDNHKYYTFAEKHTSRTPWDIIGVVWTELDELNGMAGNVVETSGAPAVFIGEYSCVLAPQCWGRAPSSERGPLTQKFGGAQSQMWQAKCSGSAFWTFKMDWMPGGEWGFKEQVEKNHISAPAGTSLSNDEVQSRLGQADDARNDAMTNAVEPHARYWDQQSPGAHFEHWRYADGWNMGWSDARTFFGARVEGLIPGGQTGGGDKIGATDLWVLKRMQEQRCADKRAVPCAWEFETGFRRGMADFYGKVGV